MPGHVQAPVAGGACRVEAKAPKGAVISLSGSLATALYPVQSLSATSCCSRLRCLTKLRVLFCISTPRLPKLSTSAVAPPPPPSRLLHISAVVTHCRLPHTLQVATQRQKPV